MRSNKNRLNFSVPSKLYESLDEWTEIAHDKSKKIRSSIYKGTYTKNKRTIHQVQEALKELYFNKCAYCESTEYQPEIEHYRPKAGVHEDKKHSGYYWLCYEWSNLLPSCRYCNTSGGKGNQFPILGQRVYSPTIIENMFIIDQCNLDAEPLINEKPFLLHPERDQVEGFFTFHQNGIQVGTDRRNRGKRTVEICNLNRDNLIIERQKVIDNHVKDLEDILIHFKEINEQNILFCSDQIELKLFRLVNNTHVNNPFSLLNMVCFRDYKELIIEQLPSKILQDFVEKIYNSFYKKIND